jgi:hypothetical protein
LERISSPQDQQQEKVFDRTNIPPILTGVSAGALISTAISCGVTPDSAMNVCLDVANQTKVKGGLLDVLKPGFSLIDTLERLFVSELKKALGGSGGEDADADDYDNDLLMNRIQNGRLLRIGLTDRTKMNLLTSLTSGSLKSDVSAYVYADQYRDIHDIVSAAILSSYIPIGTGPLSIQFGQQSNNLAISRAWECVKAMEQLGFLKHGESSMPVTTSTVKDPDDETRYIDGGIANICPEIDNQTLIVCPFNGTYGTHFIAPRYLDDLDSITDAIEQETMSIPNRLRNIIKDGIHISDRVQFGLNRENLLTAYLMARSSESTVLEKRFRDGYDDAHRYLKEQNLLTVFTS